jgi:hypothetical protein
MAGDCIAQNRLIHAPIIRAGGKPRPYIRIILPNKSRGGVYLRPSSVFCLKLKQELPILSSKHETLNTKHSS